MPGRDGVALMYDVSGDLWGLETPLQKYLLLYQRSQKSDVFV